MLCTHLILGITVLQFSAIRDTSKYEEGFREIGRREEQRDGEKFQLQLGPTTDVKGTEHSLFIPTPCQTCWHSDLVISSTCQRLIGLQLVHSGPLMRASLRPNLRRRRRCFPVGCVALDMPRSLTG
jgi:hypothetical protein